MFDCQWTFCIEGLNLPLFVPWLGNPPVGRVIISALLASDCKWWVNFSVGGTLPVNYTANRVRGKGTGDWAARDGGGEGPRRAVNRRCPSKRKMMPPEHCSARAWGMISHVTHACAQNPHLNENLPSRVNKAIISQYKLRAGNKAICCTDRYVFLSSSSSNVTKLKLLLKHA